MDGAAAYIFAIIVVLVLFVAGAYAWDNYIVAWQDFSYSGGDIVSFSSGTASLGKLRFKDCTFTTKSPKGQSQSWDVTGVLNGMAAAYDIPTKKKTLTLGGSANTPLNPFSFVRLGFNDASIVPTQAASNAWGAVPPKATTLVGKWRVL